MPNGPSSPLAKIPSSEGASAPSGARMMRMRPERVSAMKRSPFGAVRIRRGPDRPEENWCTVNPSGTDKAALAGLSTVCGPFCADRDAKGGGKRSMCTWWTLPGVSFIQSPALFCPLAASAAKVAGSTLGRVARYEIRYVRSVSDGIITTMAVPGTRSGGLVRKRSSVDSSQLRLAARSARVYPKYGIEAAGRPTMPPSTGPCPAVACTSCPVAWQSAQLAWKSVFPCTGSPAAVGTWAAAGFGAPPRKTESRAAATARKG